MKEPTPVKLGHHVLYRCASGDLAWKDIILRGSLSPKKETIYRPATVVRVCERDDHDAPESPPRVNLRILADAEPYADAYKQGVKHHSTVDDADFPAWITSDELETGAE